MKITLTPSGGSAITIGDDSVKWLVDGFLPVPERDVQIAKRTRAGWAGVIKRDNCWYSIPFTVERVHEDYDDAVWHVATHPLDLLNLAPALLTVIQTSSTGTRTVYYPNAVCKSCRPVYSKGITTIFAYEFWTGEPSTTLPT